MDKISLPFRIVLIVALVFAVVWFLVLRPKPAADSEPAVTPPGVTGLANDVAKANKAVDVSNAAAARREAAAKAVGGSSTTATKPSATSAKPATTTKAKAATPAKPAAAAVAKPTKPATTVAKPAAPVAKPAKPGLAADAAPGDPSRPLLASVDAGKVAVVLFWNNNASDDRATRRGLRSIDLHGGKVVATAVPIGDVGRYEAITRGVQVLESPTLLVIGAGGKARVITGYTQPKEIDQAVSDIGGKGFEARKAFQHTGFAKVADDACKDWYYLADQRADLPTTNDKLVVYLVAAGSEFRHMTARLKRAHATAATDRALKAALIQFSDRELELVNTGVKQLRGGADRGTVVNTIIEGENAAEKPMFVVAKKARARGCYAAPS